MICNLCDEKNPDDARYCIGCGNELGYTGQTTQLNRRKILTDDIEAETRRALITEIQTPSGLIAASNVNLDPRTWSLEDFGKPLYVSREKLYELMRSPYYFSSLGCPAYYYGRQIILVEKMHTDYG